MPSAIPQGGYVPPTVRTDACGGCGAYIEPMQATIAFRHAMACSDKCAKIVGGDDLEITDMARTDGDPCAMIDGHVPLDLLTLNAAYREKVGLEECDHSDDEPWEHRWYVSTYNDFGDEVWNWTAEALSPGAKPCTVWKGP